MELERIFDPQAIMHAFERSALGATPEDLQWDVTPEGRRLQWLAKLAADPDGGFRPLITVDDGTIERLEALLDTAPNMSAITRVILRAVKLAIATNSAPTFPHVCAEGPPGVGKSRFAREAAAALGTAFHACLLSDVSELLGLSLVWRGAQPGLIARSLLQTGATAQPFILVDEINMSSRDRDDVDPAAALLTLLEPETAAHFQDRYIGDDIELAAHRCIWLATSNNTSSLPRPLMDRLLRIEVCAPSAAEQRRIAEAIYAQAVRTHGRVFNKSLAPAVADLLAEIPPRRLRLCLDLAMGWAADAGRVRLSTTDVRAALRLMGANERPKIGFFAKVDS